ncbi:hypothetical protein FOZ61_002424 [Perkinsus olseni]|uniref:Uncharacterized protein n=1 Tax=Perkinsus olseni TaxID=32597 RepID=A0A7J6LT88_PEROL|nr:hypothetical protein FOZ61_002424 [Perkinsus olseni]KAF4672811.1 hypothetical protein FOL46_008351 [Perkinsus olseni]
MGLIGVTLVTRPTAIFHGQDESASPSTESTSAVAACIMGAAVSGLVPVIVRRIGDSVHQYCLVFYFGGTGTLLATAMLLTRFQSLLVPAAADSLEAYSLLAAICMLGLGTQFTFNRAMQIEKPQVCAVGTKDSTEPLSTIGACLIVSSTLAILFAKGAKAQAESKTSEAEKGSVRVYGRE